MNDHSTAWICDPDKVAILIADDDAMIRDLLRSTLRKLGHHNVRDAASGEDALSQCQERWPQLIFLDIEMPGELNGMGVLNQLRATDKPTYVIMITAHSTLNNVRQAVAQRVDGFLVKPFDADRIHRVLEQFHKSHC
jgi:two-component system chemotaxis response regulator CheY